MQKRTRNVSQPANSTLLAVDVGNNRVKIGRFEWTGAAGIPQPGRTWVLPCGGGPLDAVVGQCHAGSASLDWWIGSVNRSAASRLIDWLGAHRPQDRLTLLASGDLPIRVELPRPDMVGIDRLLDAVAVNRVRAPGRQAVLVDLGTAITVDLISAEGAFLGGAILPGVEMSARALHEYTDMLPQIAMSELADPPEPIGKATQPAMRSGVYWGTIGAVRELIRRMTAGAPQDPEIYLTGGAAPTIAGLLGRAARHAPHLTLSGTALTAWAMAGRFA